MRRLLLTLAVLLATNCLLAQEDELTKPIGKDWDKKKECSIDTPSGVLAVKMQGYNLCVASMLAQEKGAKSQIKKFGCQPAFLVKKAFCINGDPLPKMEGWYIYYLKTDTSRPLLMKKARNRRFIVKGRLYVPQRMLEVTSYKMLKRKKKAKKIAEMVKKQGKTAPPSAPKGTTAAPWYQERLQAARKKLGLPATQVTSAPPPTPEPKKEKPKETKKDTVVKPWYQERLEEAKRKLEEKKDKK